MEDTTKNPYEEVSLHFRSPKVQKALAEIDAKYELKQKGVMLDDLLTLLEYGELAVADIPMLFEQEFEMDFERALDVNDDLFRDVFRNVSDSLAMIRQDFLLKQKQGDSVLTLTGYYDIQQQKKKEVSIEDKSQDELEEDEIEAAREVTGSLEKKESVQDLVNEVVKESGVVFSEDNLKKRFSAIIESRFKEIRNDVQTNVMLRRQTKVGGLGLRKDDADKIVSLLKARMARYHTAVIIDSTKRLANIKEKRVSPKNAGAFATEEKKKFERAVMEREGQHVATDANLVSHEEHSGGSEFGVSHVTLGPGLDPSRTKTPLLQTPPKEKKLRPDTGVLNRPSFASRKQLAPPPPAPAIRERPRVPSLSQNQQDQQKRQPPHKTDQTPALIDFEHRLAPPVPMVRDQQPTEKPKLSYRSPLTILKPKAVSVQSAQQASSFETNTSISRSSNTVVNKRLVKMEQKIELQPKKPSSKKQPKKKVPSKTASMPEPTQPRYDSKLTDPIEELERMTHENFKQLDPDPQKACEKIEEKIQLVEEERSFGGRVQGIKGWQKSEPYRMYLDMGRDSMILGTPIPDLVAKRINEGKPSLSVDEFNAIMRLNKRLKF